MRSVMTNPPTTLNAAKAIAEAPSDLPTAARLDREQQDASQDRHRGNGICHRHQRRVQPRRHARDEQDSQPRRKQANTETINARSSTAHLPPLQDCSLSLVHGFQRSLVHDAALMRHQRVPHDLVIQVGLVEPFLKRFLT